MAFTDEYKDRFKMILCTGEEYQLGMALIARLEAAESRECNQYHCGHASCNHWRKAAGK